MNGQHNNPTDRASDIKQNQGDIKQTIQLVAVDQDKKASRNMSNDQSMSDNERNETA